MNPHERLVELCDSARLLTRIGKRRFDVGFRVRDFGQSFQIDIGFKCDAFARHRNIHRRSPSFLRIREDESEEVLRPPRFEADRSTVNIVDHHVDTFQNTA